MNTDPSNLLFILVTFLFVNMFDTVLLNSAFLIWVASIFVYMYKHAVMMRSV